MSTHPNWVSLWLPEALSGRPEEYGLPDRASLKSLSLGQLKRKCLSAEFLTTWRFTPQREASLSSQSPACAFLNEHFLSSSAYLLRVLCPSSLRILRCLKSQPTEASTGWVPESSFQCPRQARWDLFSPLNGSPCPAAILCHLTTLSEIFFDAKPRTPHRME